MLDWPQLAQRIEASTRTTEKSRLLAGALRQASVEELGPLCRVLGAVPSALGGDLGWAGIARAAEQVAGAPAGSLVRLVDEAGDLGVAVEELLESERPIAGEGVAAEELARTEEQRIRHDAAGIAAGATDTSADASIPALVDIETALRAIASSSGQRRHDLLVQLLYRCPPRAARYLVRMVSGGVGIGVRDGLLEAAIAEAFAVPLGEVRRALLMEGDPGQVAVLARGGRIGESRLRYFHAIPPALAAPALVLSETLERFADSGASGLLAEEKYDGIRAHLHLSGGRAALFGRDGTEISVAFPEIIAAALESTHHDPVDAIFDGEIVANVGGERVSSESLYSRLRGGETTLRSRETIGVQLAVFDIIGLGDRLLVDLPLSERRQMLDRTNIGDQSAATIFRARSWLVHTGEELERALVEAQMQGSEGLVVKSLGSTYAAGRRSSAWIKVKRSARSIDCVVVGADLGLGRRRSLLTELTFAVRDDLSGRLTTLGRASAPHDDDAVAWLNRWFEEHTVAQLGRHRSVEPRVVVEVRYEELRRSETSPSGYRLTSPRIARIRHDLGPDQIATLSSIEARASGTVGSRDDSD